MFRLFYISAATRFASGSKLNEILSDARARNRANGVTSVLLYCEGSFAQLLEGPKEAVLDTYRHIEADSRHSSCTIIFQEDARERILDGWDCVCVPTSIIAGADRFDFMTRERFFASPQYAALTKEVMLKSFLKSFNALAPSAPKTRPGSCETEAKKPSAEKIKTSALIRSDKSRYIAANDNVTDPRTPTSQNRRPRPGFRLFPVAKRTP